MSCSSAQDKISAVFYFESDISSFGRKAADSAHSSINRKMNFKFFYSEFLTSGRKKLYVFLIKNKRRNSSGNNFFNFIRRTKTQHENRRSNAGISKHNAFFISRNRKIIRTSFKSSPRARDSSMSVGIGFYSNAHFCFRL